MHSIEIPERPHVYIRDKLVLELIKLLKTKDKKKKERYLKQLGGGGGGISNEQWYELPLTAHQKTI